MTTTQQHGTSLSAPQIAHVAPKSICNYPRELNVILSSLDTLCGYSRNEIFAALDLSTAQLLYRVELTGETISYFVVISLGIDLEFRYCFGEETIHNNEP